MEHKAVAFIRKTPDMPCLHGTHNGYVAVPPTNKYHGKHYFDIKDIKVHGDITFTEPVILGKKSFGSNREINPKYIGKRHPILEDVWFITENTEIGDDWWIFGFDTCHWGDNPVDWCKDNVIRETLDFMEQLCKE